MNGVKDLKTRPSREGVIPLDVIDRNNSSKNAMVDFLFLGVYRVFEPFEDNAAQE